MKRCQCCEGLLLPIPDPRVSFRPTRALREALARSLKEWRERTVATATDPAFSADGVARVVSKVDERIRLLRAPGPLDAEAYSALVDVRCYDDEFSRAILPLLCVCSGERRDARLAWSLGSSRQVLAGELDSAVMVLEGMKDQPWAAAVAKKLRPRVARAARGETFRDMAAAGDQAASMVVRGERWLVRRKA